MSHDENELQHIKFPRQSIHLQSQPHKKVRPLVGGDSWRNHLLGTDTTDIPRCRLDNINTHGDTNNLLDINYILKITTMANKNENKGTMAFADTILQYLEKRAENDALFAVKFANPLKSVDDCVRYIISEVQKSGCNGFTDDEIFGKAVHYFEENEIEVGNPINCQVVVNHTVELTEEEKEQARQDAIERLRQEEMAKMRKHSQPKPTTEKKTQDVQPSLFDF